MKYEMPFEEARKLGYAMADAGWAEEQIRDWLLDTGYPLNGITAGRIRRAYYFQLYNR